MLRTALMPLSLESFCPRIQEDFCEYVDKTPEQVNILLKKSSYRAALASMISDTFEQLKACRQPRDLIDYKGEPIELEDELAWIKNDLANSAACRDEPIAKFMPDDSWGTVCIYEDLSVVILYPEGEGKPEFYDNYYKYIYNNYQYLQYQSRKTPEISDVFKRAGITFSWDSDGNLIGEYNKKFLDGLFASDNFRFKR